LVLPFFYVKSTQVVVLVGVAFLIRPVAVLEMLAAKGGSDWVESWATPSAFLAAGDLAEKGLLELLRLNLFEMQAFRWVWLLESGRLSQMFGLALIGMALGRIDFFLRLEGLHRKCLAGLLVSCLVAATIHLAYTAISKAALVNGSNTYPFTLFVSILGSWQNISYTAVLFLAFILCYCSRARPLLGSFIAPGRMTLTLYVGQSLVFIPYFYEFGLNQHASVSQSMAAVIGVLAFGVQVVLARLWLERFLYGPLEWVWRAGTYLTTGLPLRRSVGFVGGQT
jgi:uncharacterized protein